MLLTEHHLEIQSLKGVSTGSSESILVKMKHSWKSLVTAQIMMQACMNVFCWLFKDFLIWGQI